MNLSLNRFTFFFSLTALFFSCTKITTTDIGAGLIPPVDGVITKDTVLDVISKNTAYDTVSVGISDNHVLGFVNDNVFGTTTASLNFQIAPNVTPLSWGINRDSVVVDSVVLCLSYQSVWGDSTQQLKLHVYSMDPEIIFNADSSYNNTVTFEKSTDLTEFGGKFIYPYTLNDIDTTAHYREIATNQLRIRLNNSFGQQLVELDSPTYYRSDSAFYTAVRGLIVEPEQNFGNALLSISLTDTATHLSVYYHSKNLADTLTRRFSPNSLTSASSNTILRNYQNSPIPSYIAGASTNNDDLIFMQTSPGVYATIQTPGVSSLSNRIIHRAELLMYQVPDPTNDKWLTPPNLFLAAYNQDSVPYRRMVIPNDITFSGSSITNLTQFGVLPKTTGSTTYYSFDITRYVQGIITRKEKQFQLILYAPYNQYIYPVEATTITVPIASPSLNTVGVGRVRLGGGSNSQYKMRLHIVYSLVQ